MSVPRSPKPALSTCCIHSPGMGAWWMQGARASDHKEPKKPDEKAVVPRASRRREDTSDGGGACDWGTFEASSPSDLGGQRTCTLGIQKVWGAEGGILSL